MLIDLLGKSFGFSLAHQSPNTTFFVHLVIGPAHEADGEMSQKHFIVFILGLGCLMTVIGVMTISRSKTGTVIGTIQDSLKGDSVYKAKIVIGGRSTIRYRDKTFKITNLAPGPYTLRINASGFEPVAKHLLVKKGNNRIHIPLKGIEVPDLHDIIIFVKTVKGQGLLLQIRFISKEGIGIEHFPKLPLRLDVKLFTRLGGEKDFIRGKQIYEGPVDLMWVSNASLEKNQAMLPKEKIQLDADMIKSYGVLDAILHTPQGDFKYTRADIQLDF